MWKGLGARGCSLGETLGGGSEQAAGAWAPLLCWLPLIKVPCNLSTLCSQPGCCLLAVG